MFVFLRSEMSPTFESINFVVFLIRLTVRYLKVEIACLYKVL